MENKNENKWVIGIDLDGTTLMSHKPEYVVDGRRVDRVHPETIDAIKQMKELGHEVVINTGRNFLQAKPVYDLLGLDGWAINSAGGHIHNPNDPNAKEIVIGIPNHIMKEILNDSIVMDRNDGWSVDYINDTYMVAEEGSVLYGYGQREWKTTMFDGEFDFDTQCSVLYFNKPKEEIYKVVEYMREKWGDIVHVTNWGTTGGEHGGIELNPAASNKGTALLMVADELGIDHKNTMGFGDGENDLELIKKAEHGVAMSHAVDYIKKHANHVTEQDNNEGGVGLFLKSFFNLK